MTNSNDKNNTNGAADAGLVDERDLQFRQMADSFIDVANGCCEKQEPAMVSSSFLYGASRFCAFVVAAKTGNRDNYNAERDAAIEYYANEFKTMLEENLNDYSRVFDSEE